MSHSDLDGGAARAAYRLHRALLQHGVESQMKVRNKKADDARVEGPVGTVGKFAGAMRARLGNLLMRLQSTVNVNPHSGNWLPSRWAKDINASRTGVVNLHWVGGETLSIEDIGQIGKPVVWTLHDMWPFCGTEHYTEDSQSARWRSGYATMNRSTTDSGFDLDCLVWQRKKRAWKQPMRFIAPSNWLASCVRESALLRNWPVSVIPNVLDTSVYRPLDPADCRRSLGLPTDKRIILFGAMGARRDARKGYDLLHDALIRLRSRMNVQDVVCVVFGESEPKNATPLPVSMRWLGHVHDETTLVCLYSAADVMVVPSRQENLPQTATEPQACGCPVVAFNCTGLPDAVADRETGYLAQPFDVEDLAEGLRWVLSDSDRRVALGRSARARAVRLWSPSVVVPQYLQVYEEALAQHGG